VKHKLDKDFSTRTFPLVEYYIRWKEWIHSDSQKIKENFCLGNCWGENFLYHTLYALSIKMSEKWCHIRLRPHQRLGVHQLLLNLIIDCSNMFDYVNFRHLGSNLIQYIPSAVTSGTKLPSIVTLYLTGNKLTFIESGTFTGLTTLQIL
jgi:hypothetical protein